MEKLYDLPIVGDVGGEGYFFGIELVKDQATRDTFTDEERRAMLGRDVLRASSRPGCTAAPTIAVIPSFSWPRR